LSNGSHANGNRHVIKMKAASGMSGITISTSTVDGLVPVIGFWT